MKAFKEGDQVFVPATVTAVRSIGVKVTFSNGEYMLCDPTMLSPVPRQDGLSATIKAFREREAV